MERSALIDALKTSIASGELRRDEILALFPEQGEIHKIASPEGDSHDRGWNLASLLYYVGGGIAFLGLVLFVGQNWEDLTSLLRITLTLGAGLGFFVSAIALESTKRFDRVPDAFHLFAGLLIPGGILVTLDELGVHGTGWGVGIIFSALAVSYALVQHFYRNNLVLAFAIVYATTAVLMLTDMVGRTGGMENWDDFTSYRFLLIGGWYILLARLFRETNKAVLVGWLYGFGTLAVLGSVLALGGWKPDQSAFWETIDPVVVFGMMFLATQWKSRSMLFFGAIFLIAYVSKITAEYFSDSLSWPLMLVLAGFVLIGVGYLTFYLNKRYLRTVETSGT